MKPGTLFCSTLAFSFVLTAASSDIPHLRKQGTATQLIVDGQPFLALAGELSNSSSSSVEYAKPIWPMLAVPCGRRPYLDSSWTPVTTFWRAGKR